MSIRLTTPPGGAAAAPRSGNWTPSDHGLGGWSLDMASCTAGAALPVAGTLNVIKVHVASATTVTNILGYISTAGSGLIAGQCGAALYDVAGNRLGSTSDQATAWASGGLKTMALTAPVAIAAGDYYVALWANGTTLPAFQRGPSISAAFTNIGTIRSATGNTGVTTTAPATLGALTNAAPMWWVALS